MTRNLTRWLRFLFMFYLLFSGAIAYFVYDGTLPWTDDLMATSVSHVVTLLGILLMLKQYKLGFYIICLASLGGIGYNYFYSQMDFLSASIGMLYVPVITALFLRSNWHIMK
ncbi:MAG: hypothetical protein IJN28_07790 [Selenomonadales bacterium]|nr:hypothetical protein [Selenomonadales bacterium]